MWLTLDIGNSSIKGGLFDGPQLRRTFRLMPQRDAGSDDIAVLLAPHLTGVTISRAGVCSVVPERTPVVTTAVVQTTGVEPLRVHSEMPLPFELAYDTPHTLGADRLAAAAAGWVLFGSANHDRSVVVIDAGTAVTYEIIERPGRYVGGAIAPGPDLLQAALHHGTAQLPSIPLVLPDRVIGRSTREAIQSGVMYGFVDAVRGMLVRIGDQLGEIPLTVATGGWSTVLKAHLPEIQHAEPDLVLHGIRILMEESA